MQHIIVVNTGWVFVGDITPHDDITKTYVTNAYNIRQWGTERGLGQLAVEGSTKTTVLDFYGELLINNAMIIYLIVVDGKVKLGG